MIRSVPGRTPRIDPEAYVDPQAAVIGDVTIAAGDGEDTGIADGQRTSGRVGHQIGWVLLVAALLFFHRPFGARISSGENNRLALNSNIPLTSASSRPSPGGRSPPAGGGSTPSSVAMSRWISGRPGWE